MKPEALVSSSISDKINKFYELNDDLVAVQNVTRRVFFEFLRTKPTITTEELDMLWSVADLLADLCNAKRND
jgi:hypothetical protein